VTCDIPKTCVRAQELRIDVKTRLRDDTVHGAAHRDAIAPQGSEEAGCSDVAVYCRLNDRQSQQNAPGSPEAVVGSESLQYLRDDDREHGQIFFHLEGGIQPHYV
jgi:tRNA-dihydrouridine synthase